MKIIFVLLGYIPTSVYEKSCNLAEELGYEILGFVDFDRGDKIFSTFANYPVYPNDFIYKLNWELVVAGYKDHQAKDFLRRFDGDFSDRTAISILWLLKQKIIRKYEDTQDFVIQETLEYWKNHDLDVFNQHLADVPDTFNEVFVDEENEFPYIYFETVEGKMKKMYYPKIAMDDFAKIDGKKFVLNLLHEQTENSPHLYITGKHKVNYGDVLIDAGVCEGNFALKYVDVCSKIYLFEPDPKWLEPLYLTFADYADKIVLIPKFVSNFSEKNFVAIDDVVKISQDKNIFLKMDVEGEEISALHGAKNLLTKNKIKASICSYHHRDDLWKIKSIFKNHNYSVWTSKGYMIFIHDSEFWETADFRKGIVYAENY